MGKSAILRTAQASRHGREWLSGEEARELAISRLDPREVAQVVDREEFAPVVEHSLRALARSGLRPARMINSLGMLRKSCADLLELQVLGLDHVIVDDELLLHRGSSLFAGSIHAAFDARTYYAMVPAPDAVVVVSAEPQTIFERVRHRSHTPNVYRDLSDSELNTVIESSVELAEIAGDVFEERGVPVHRIDADRDVSESAEELGRILRSFDVPWQSESFHERLVTVSGTFRKGTGRHQLRNQGLAYCAFSVPGFSVPRAQAQRDARRRVDRFGIRRSDIQGRTVLDLGANSGAMVFQISNFDPAYALGIEYDPDKVELATAIAEATGITQVAFKVGDIDLLDAERLGTFDVVFALAIERHVQDPDRLYELLGAVTGETLYFEGNAKADMEGVIERLRLAGFRSFEMLGVCDDDISPPNNTRPLLVARKRTSSAESNRGEVTGWWRAAAHRLRGGDRE